MRTQTWVDGVFNRTACHSLSIHCSIAFIITLSWIVVSTATSQTKEWICSHNTWKKQIKTGAGARGK